MKLSSKKNQKRFSFLMLLAMLTTNVFAPLSMVGNVFAIEAEPIVYEYDFIAYDGGVNGNIWAKDYIHSVLTLIPTTEDCYDFTRVDTGTFESTGNGSPADESTLFSGVVGDLTGGLSGEICGTLIEDPDLSYVQDFTVGTYPGGTPKYFWRIFEEGTISFPTSYSWGWEFESCNNGTWINDQTGNMGDIKGRYIPCGDVQNLGYNIRSESTTANERPVDVTCGETTHGDYITEGNGKIAHNWFLEDAPSYIKYQRQYMWPGTGVWTTDGTAYANDYTGFATFGSAAGTEGIWNTRVRAWADVDGNGVLDEAVDSVSDWSNECTVTYDRDYDNIAPTITLELPTYGVTYAGEIDLKAVCDEECDYVNFWWRKDGESYSNVSPERNYHRINDNGTVFTWTLDTLDAERWGGDPSYVMEDGVYYLYAAGKDTSGNWAKSSQVMIIVDNTAPAKVSPITILDHEGYDLGCDGYTNNRKITVDWGDNSELDVDHYDYRILDGRIIAQLAPSVTERAGTIRDADGYYKYQVRAVDEVGNEGEWSDWCGVTLDREAPTIDTIEDQVLDEGQLVNFGILNGLGIYDNVGLNNAYVHITYTDLYGILRLDESGVLDASDAGGDGLGGTLNEWFEYVFESSVDFGDYAIVLDSAVIPEGIYTLTYYVDDLAGNQSTEYTVTITINNVAPIVTFQSAQTITEGQTATFNGLFTDPSTNKFEFIELLVPTVTEEPSGEEEGMMYDDANWTVSVDYGEGAGYQAVGIFETPGDIEGLSHTYYEAGVYTASLKVCEADSTNTNWYGLPDGDGECSEASVEVIVTNNAPEVTVIPSTTSATVGDAAVTVTANVTGGNAAYTYNWTGDCSGTSSTTTISTAVAGTFTCTATVTDVDGDIDTDSTTVNVASAVVPQVLGVQTQNTDDENNEGDGEEAEEEVLGTQDETCSLDKVLSGYIFEDKDSDGEYTEGEVVYEGVEISIYDNEGELVDTVKSDENGYWEVAVCAGSYTAEVNTETLPDNAELVTAELTAVLGENDEEVSLNILVANTEKSFLEKYWIAILISLLVAAGGAFALSKRK